MSFARHHAAAIVSFAAGAAVFAGCEFVTAGVGTIGCAAAVGLVSYGMSCGASAGGCSVTGALVSTVAGALAGVLGGSLAGALGGKLAATALGDILPNLAQQGLVGAAAGAAAGALIGGTLGATSGLASTPAETTPTTTTEDTGTAVFRTPRIGFGDSELGSGLNPANHLEGDQSAYVGTENVARDFANPKVGGYENGYVRYNMAPEFNNEFSQYKFPYVKTSGANESE